jgi:DNA-binding MarR family transcriptional regulator
MQFSRRGRVSQAAFAVRQESPPVPGKPRLELDDYLPYLVNRVGSALASRFTTEALAGHDLSLAMWRVLVALSSNGEQRQIDLAAMTSIEVSTLSRLVTRLASRGLVTRNRSASDSREVAVRLSAQGRNVVDRLIPVARALEEQAIAGLAPRELALVKQALRQCYRNLTAPGAVLPAAEQEMRRRSRPG